MIIQAREETLRGLASSHDWPALAAALAGSREPGDVWLRTFARNMADLRAHRPAVYDAILDAGEEIAPPAPRTRDDRMVRSFADADVFRRTGQTVAILGAGDGSILRASAKFPPALTLGRQQGMELIEPDLGRLIAMLGQADLAGPRGPIRQRRFGWHVGADWADTLAGDLIAMPTKMFPQHTIDADGPRPEIEEALSRVASRVKLATSARAVAADAYYESLDDGELVALFGPNPPRLPRVLLVTSQFTTVLQFSTNDSADAFRRLGCEVRVVTEPHPWHLVSKPAIRAAIADFRPDLLFQIDHLRYELGDAVPPKLPFVCWIQDHLVNLTNTTAGESIGERDFILTGGAYRYVERYGYPRRQCIDMPKVARAPERPASWTCDREDIFYVSHWSHTPESIVVELCNRVRELGGSAAEATMRACAAELSGVYARGSSMRTDLEVRELVLRVFAERKEACTSEQERFYVDALFQRLNNAFYRQQALAWAGQLADEMGLKFGIYGTGWEKHPTLGRFARGPITYGPDLEKLTRESKILLQIEPYACYTHQRMLDGLLAGGFALIREHPLNTLPFVVRNFLDAHVPPAIVSEADARACLAPELRERFDRILAEASILRAMGDVVDVVRCWQRAGILGEADEALPHLNEIGFDSLETLRDRVKRFIADDAERRRIADDQRASIEHRLTYVSALGRAVRSMHRLLSENISVSTVPSKAEAA